MQLKESVTTCLSKYVTFSGRASSSEFWWFMLAIQIAIMLPGIVIFFASMFSNIMSNYSGGGSGGGLLMMVIGILYMIISLGAIIPSISAGSRRLHDTGKSGWWQLLWLLGIIPLVGILVLIAMIYLFAQKSQEGENKYG